MADEVTNAIDFDDIKQSVEESLGRTPEGWSGLTTKLFTEVMEAYDDEDYARKLMDTGSLATGHVPPIALCLIPGGVFHLNQPKFWRM